MSNKENKGGEAPPHSAKEIKSLFHLPARNPGSMVGINTNVRHEVPPLSKSPVKKGLARTNSKQKFHLNFPTKPITSLENSSTIPSPKKVAKPQAHVVLQSNTVPSYNNAQNTLQAKKESKDLEHRKSEDLRKNCQEATTRAINNKSVPKKEVVPKPKPQNSPSANSLKSSVGIFGSPTRMHAYLYRTVSATLKTPLKYPNAGSQEISGAKPPKPLLTTRGVVPKLAWTQAWTKSGNSSIVKKVRGIFEKPVAEVDKVTAKAESLPKPQPEQIPEEAEIKQDILKLGLQSTKSKIQRKLDALIRRINALAAENKELFHTNEDLYDENLKLVRTSHTLRAENKVLIQKNKGYQDANRSLIQKNIGLETKSKTLVQKNKTLKAEKKSFKEELIRLHSIIESKTII